MFSPVRTKLPRVLAVLAAACLLIQAPAAASTDAQLQREREQAERRREQVGDELDAARSNLAEIRRQQKDTLSRLRSIDSERAVLQVELERLDAELAAAEALVQEAELALRRTDAEIERNTAELDDTQRELELQRDRLRARVRASFMHGGVNYPEAVLDVETANELGASLQYMRSMMSEDQNQVQQITSLERRYEAAIGRLDTLRAVQDEAKAERARERNRVAELVKERQEVAAELQARVDEHQGVLAELEGDEQRYAAAIDALEDESDAIRGRLANIAAKDRAGSGGGGGTPTSSSGRFQWPVNGALTSSFGYRTHPVLGTRRLHAGVDFGAGTGTPIVAADGGTVVSAGWHGGYGNAVIIDHGGGVATLYGHQSRLAVSSGARVSRGQVVGYVGSTGMSTGPHLHFELRINGVPSDPMARLRG
jgi:murein DD-endopeptidase MepM/ murein hydrolase activator NlpD